MDKQERIKRFGEVFTPKWVVDQMLDALPEDAFEPGKTFLEPTCGDGAFLVEILRRKFERCRCRKDYSHALDDVYAMEIQQDNVAETIRRCEELCRSYFKPSKQDLETLRDHVIQCDSLKVMRLLARWMRE